MLTAQQVIEILNLKPHPAEGGYFSEYYRCTENITKSALPERYHSERSMSTAIYYMLTPDSFSAMHVLESDEIFHYYLGDPVEILLLYPDGTGEVKTLGQDILNGMQLQVVVPKGVWQGSRLKSGGNFALMATTVAPGFDYADFKDGNREELIREYPSYKELITALSR